MQSRIRPIKSYTADPENENENITAGYNRISGQRLSQSLFLLAGRYEITPPSDILDDELKTKYIKTIVSNGVEDTLSKIRKLYFGYVPERVNISTKRGTLLGATRLNQTPAKMDTLEYVRALFDTTTFKEAQIQLVDTTIESMVSPVLVSEETIEKVKKEALKKARLEALAKKRELEQDGPTR